MGVKHLKELREYLEQNKEKAFTRTELRDELKQNYPTILDNIDYLVDQEKLVEQLEGKPVKFKWKKGIDTDGQLLKKESNKA